MSDWCISNIIIPILTAFLAGGLTLAGVCITIKKSDRVRVEEREESARPFFSVIDSIDAIAIESNNHALIFTADGNYNSSMCYLYGNFVNYQKAEFLIQDIKIDKQIFSLESQFFIEKGMSFFVRIYYKDKKIISSGQKIIMNVLDVNYKLRQYKLHLNNRQIVKVEEMNAM